MGPSILLPAVVTTTTKFIKKKVLKFLWVGKVVYIVLLRPSTPPHVIVDFVKIVDINLLRPATLTQLIAEVMDIGQVLPATLTLIIAEDLLIYVDIFHNRSSPLPISIREQDFMLKEEVDIGL